MDITISPVTAPPQFQTPTAAKASLGNDSTGQTDVQDSLSPQLQQIALTAANSNTPNFTQQYESSQREAALSFKNVYAVSDKSFTIFKDATGAYITRYVSLRDGSVSYYPSAPALVKPLQSSTPQIAIHA